jgi:hypothetical protein
MRMEPVEKVQVTIKMEAWLKKVLRRKGYETERSVSRMIADTLIEAFHDAPENPDKQRKPRKI